MKRIVLTIVILFILAPYSFSQRILFQSDFENIPLNFPDSIPFGWRKLDVDMNNPTQGWAVRDTTQIMGGNPLVNRPRAHSGKKSLHISWLAGNGGNNLNDDWVWTDSLRILNGDSLIWWMLIGATPNITPNLDSVQIWVCSAQTPGSATVKLATIKSNDSAGIPFNNNTWTLHKFNLSSFNGQRIYIAWRYYIVINATTGLWVNIDDLFIGNHSAIGIQQIGNNVPKTYELKQNYPNPFNPVTFIEFDLPKSDYVNLIIYNSLGQQIEMPINQFLTAGNYRIEFNAAHLSSGLYFYRINTEKGFVQTRKMILVK